MRALPIVALLGFALAVSSFGSHPKDEADAGVDSYESIVIEPGAARVAVALGGTVTKRFFVYGVTGAVRTEITAACALSIDPVFDRAWYLAAEEMIGCGRRGAPSARRNDDGLLVGTRGVATQRSAMDRRPQPIRSSAARY